MTFDVARALERLGIDATKRGRRLWALCPNRDHDDRDPSWFAWSAEAKEKAGLHRCFSCGFSGNLPQLVAYVLRLESAREGREWLSGDVVAQEAPRAVRISVRSIHRASFALPDEVHFAPLEEWPSLPRRYLLRRGITAEQVERWRIGYAVDGRLGGRVVLVVRDAHGRPTSYTGRAYDGNDRRYLNPLDFEGADKSAIFGEEHWPPSEERDTVFAAEGAFKVLAIERALGSVSLAGLMGSRIHPRHLLKLAAFRSVVYVEDHGEAGLRAAVKLQASLSRHVRFSRVRIIEGSDADELPREHLRRLLCTAIETKS